MSRICHRARSDDLILRALAVGYPKGHIVDEHAHDWHQLVHCTGGATEVRALDRRWILPPGRALWIPAGTLHSLRCLGRVDLRTVYLPASVGPLEAPDLAGLGVAVISVAPLLRELVEHVVGLAPLTRAEPAHRRLTGVLLDLIRPQRPLAFDLAWPDDSRAAKVAEVLWRRPSDPASIDELAIFAGTSTRTLERAFLRSAGLPIGRWRRQARLLSALRRLAEGEPVTDVAPAVGYASTSAFVAAFGRHFGETPGRMFPGATGAHEVLEDRGGDAGFERPRPG